METFSIIRAALGDPGLDTVGRCLAGVSRGSAAGTKRSGTPERRSDSNRLGFLGAAARVADPTRRDGDTGGTSATHLPTFDTLGDLR